MENGKSEHVQFDAAKHMLGLNGYHANPSAPGVTINNNIGGGLGGYILQYAAPGDEVLEGEVSDVGGVLYGRKMTDEERRTGQLIPSRPGAMIDVSPGADDRPSSASPAPSRGYDK
jgi:hypothetical protein